MDCANCPSRRAAKVILVLALSLVAIFPAFALRGADGTPLSGKYLSMIREKEKEGNLDWARAYAERLLQSRKDIEPEILGLFFRICLKSGDFTKCREILTRLSKLSPRGSLDTLEASLAAAEAQAEEERVLKSEVESMVLEQLRPPKKVQRIFEAKIETGPPPRPSYGATIDRLWALFDGGRVAEAASGWYREASRNREFISMADGGLAETLLDEFRTSGTADPDGQYIKGCLEALAGDPEVAVTALRAFLAVAGDDDPRVADARGHLFFLASLRGAATAKKTISDAGTRLIEMKKKVESLEKTVKNPHEAKKQLAYLHSYQKDLRDEIYFLKAEYNNRAIDKNAELDQAMAQALAESGTDDAGEIKAYYDRERKGAIDGLMAERDDAIALSMRRIEAVSRDIYEYEKLLEKLEEPEPARSDPQD